MKPKKLALLTFLIILISFYFLAFAVGCSTVQDFLFPKALDKDAKVNWRKEMRFRVDGVEYRGLAVLPNKSAYKIRIYPYDQTIDRLQWRTCHREDFVDKAVKKGFWPWSNTDEYFDMTFTPSEIELDRSCPLRIEGFAEKHRTIDLGIIVFKDSRPEISLDAEVLCNGLKLNYTGTSACQGARGSVHKIRFKEPVDYDDRANEKCPPAQSVSNLEFEIYMPVDECVYLFKSDSRAFEKFKTHKLITYGYEKILPPEGR